MTSLVLSNLKSIQSNIDSQKGNIEANLAAARQAALGVDDECQAAIDLLVERYKDVQVIGKIIGSQMAIKQLEAASSEVKVLEAAISVAIGSEKFISKVQQHMTADVIRDAANS